MTLLLILEKIDAHIKNRKEYVEEYNEYWSKSDPINASRFEGHALTAEREISFLKEIKEELKELR